MIIGKIKKNNKNTRIIHSTKTKSENGISFYTHRTQTDKDKTIN
jgi:hypothetical protein